jgi:DNA replication licensing factor MCM6
MIRLSEAIARANCTSEITPAFVKEAYSLLKQSIIHVEKDDVNLDEDDEDGRLGGAQPSAADSERAGDVEMETGGMTSPSGGAGTSYPVPSSPTSPSRSGIVQPRPLNLMTPQPAPAATKRKLKITHDKYMTMQSLIVLHLSEVERSTGRGEEREALIDWYLEKKEEEGGLTNMEDLEYEKELFTKVLSKLVKVRLC